MHAVNSTQKHGIFRLSEGSPSESCSRCKLTSIRRAFAQNVEFLKSIRAVKVPDVFVFYVLSRCILKHGKEQELNFNFVETPREFDLIYTMQTYKERKTRIVNFLSKLLIKLFRDGVNSRIYLRLPNIPKFHIFRFFLN